MVQDLKRAGSLRTAGDGRRGSLFGIEAEGSAEGEALERRRTNEGSDERPGGRGRSLSGTLGELWRGVTGGSREDMRGEEREGI